MKAAWLAGKRHAELALMAGTDPFTEAALETEEGRQMLEKSLARQRRSTITCYEGPPSIKRGSRGKGSAIPATRWWTKPSST
jgi:hypothetical protein